MAIQGWQPTRRLVILGPFFNMRLERFGTMNRNLTQAQAAFPHLFHASRPRPCPYLAGRFERTVVVGLMGPDATQLYHAGSKAGFRRSHNVLYRPACHDCDACIPVRVVAPDFKATASLRRVIKANRGLRAVENPFGATAEQYALFRRYQNARHANGGMHDMDFENYRAMVEDSPVATKLVEFRDPEDVLVGAMLTDRLDDGMSAIYSFFDPALGKRSLGTYMVTWLIERARHRGLDYVYLGYWIADCAKMSYKMRFRPLEALGEEGWRPSHVPPSTPE